MTNYSGPTPPQQKTLDDVKAFIAQHGFSPTVAELSALAGINNNAVSQRIDALVRKGCLNRRPGASRSLIPVTSSAVKSGDEQRHTLHLTSYQLKLLSDRLKSSECSEGDQPDELLMLVERILESVSKAVPQSA